MILCFDSIIDTVQTRFCVESAFGFCPNKVPILSERLGLSSHSIGYAELDRPAFCGILQTVL